MGKTMVKFAASQTRSRWLRTALVVIVMGVVLVPVAVGAAHQFKDVPDSNTFHDDIAWLADQDITKGCNPPTNDMFCPADNVTREQMAAFMKRLATGQAVDAGTLEGNTAGELTADAYALTSNGGQVPANGLQNTETIAQLTGIPAGSYVIMAKGYQTYVGGDGKGDSLCELVAETDVDQTRSTVDNLHHHPTSFMVVHTYTADGGTAELKCTHNGGADMVLNGVKITAISVDTLVHTDATPR
jgi:hypothetical protein